MRITRTRAVALIVLFAGIVSAGYGYAAHHSAQKQSTQEESSYANSSSVSVDVSPNNQTINIGVGPSDNAYGASTQATQVTNLGASNYAQSSAHSANLSQYQPPESGSTPMPNFDYGRPSPILQTPSPQCASTADSSYPCSP